MCFVSRNNPMVIGETSNVLKMLPKLFSNSSLSIIWSEGRAVENLDVEKASHNPIPHLMLFEYSEVIFLKIVLWANLLVGGGYRILIFRLIKKEGGLGKPINIMIAADEFVKVLGYTTWINFILMAIDSKDPLVRSKGKHFCQVSQYFSTFGVVHGFLGGSAIAFVRLLYIKFPSIIAGRDKTIAIAMTVASLVFSAMLTQLYEGVTKKGTDLLDICNGYSYELSMTKFDYDNPNKPYNIQVQLVILIGFWTVLLEIGCYITIFRFLVVHDKSMSAVLSKEKIHKRIRKNAIDLTGHVIFFAAEIGCLVIFAFFGRFLRENMRLFTRSFIMSNYGLSAVNLLFSDVLQTEAFDTMNILKKSLRTFGKIFSFKW